MRLFLRGDLLGIEVNLKINVISSPWTNHDFLAVTARLSQKRILIEDEADDDEDENDDEDDKDDGKFIFNCTNLKLI